jgi:hypothetical protein
MMLAIVNKLSDAERQSYETWFADVLTPWAQETSTSHPPEPPRIWW